MSILRGSSSDALDYASSVTSRSSIMSSHMSSHLTNISSIHIRPFQGVTQLRKALDTLYDAIKRGSSSMEYLAIQRVNQSALEDIDNKLNRHVKICYFQEEELLIIKYMPSAAHEFTAREIHNRIREKILLMGTARNELVSFGSCRYHGAHSSKEADEAFVPRFVRNKEDDWPTLVIEVGRSESLSQLRQDVRWWLIESKGDVKIALLVSIKKASSILLIEKWELGAASLDRSGPLIRSAAINSIGEPEVVQSVEVTSTETMGDSLVLEFNKLFLRAAIPPETDLIFADQELEVMAAGLLSLK